MTGLFPGFLFPATGLNRMSTPGSHGDMLSKKERKLERVHVNDRSWPKNSPVSSVYDVCNSSTCLIILNNKLSRITIISNHQRPNGSRLRGQTNIKGDIAKPDPDRHAHQHHQVQNHQQCTESHHRELTRLAPTPTSARRAEYSPWTISNASRVNPTHHASCHSHQQHEDIRQRQDSPQRAHMRTSFRGNRAATSILGDFRLSRDDRAYLSSIADAYSIEDIRRGKLLQCNELFWHAISQGGYSLPDLLKYSKYMLKPNTKKHSASKQKRGKSAHERGGTERSHIDVDRPRSNTDHTHLQSTQEGSTYQTDVASPYLKATINYNRRRVQTSPGIVRSLSARPSSETSLLSLMLDMSDASSKSRQSDNMKTENRIEETKQTSVADEDGRYDVKKMQRIGVDKEPIDAEENHAIEYANYGAEINDETGHLGQIGSDELAYKDMTSADENKIVAQDTVPDLDTEKYAHTFNETRQLQTDNEETEVTGLQELSRQVRHHKHSQEMSEFDQQQTEQEQVEQQHQQQVLSQEGEQEFAQSGLGDQSLRMADEQTTVLKEHDKEQRRTSDIIGENINSDSASVRSDSSGEGVDKSTMMGHRDPGRCNHPKLFGCL